VPPDTDSRDLAGMGLGAQAPINTDSPQMKFNPLPVMGLQAAYTNLYKLAK